MAIQEQTITAEGFLDLVERPQYEDRVLELVEGAIVEMSKPTMKHASHHDAAGFEDCQPCRDE